MKFYPLSNSFYIFFYLSVSVCDYVWVNDVVWHRPPDARGGCQILWSLRKEFVSHLMWVLVSGIQTSALVTEQQELITADPSLQCHFQAKNPFLAAPPRFFSFVQLMFPNHSSKNLVSAQDFRLSILLWQHWLSLPQSL